MGKDKKRFSKKVILKIIVYPLLMLFPLVALITMLAMFYEEHFFSVVISWGSLLVMSAFIIVPAFYIVTKCVDKKTVYIVFFIVFFLNTIFQLGWMTLAWITFARFGARFNFYLPCIIGDFLCIVMGIFMIADFARDLERKSMSV